MTSLFDTGRSLRRAGVALAAGASLFAMTGAAYAAPVVTITSVVGKWTAIAGGQNKAGLDTNVISWGTAQPSAARSSYSFVGVAPPAQGPYNADEVFNLGTFTHKNIEIPSGTGISGAKLSVDVTAMFTGETVARTLTSVFDFTHTETPNERPCFAGSVSVCDDIVKGTLNVGASESFDVVDGDTTISYYFNITGFQVGGVDFAEFWTEEGKSNGAILRGSFTADVSQIPLPAAAWLLIGGIGAIGAVSRRRKAVAA